MGDHGKKRVHPFSLHPSHSWERQTVSGKTGKEEADSKGAVSQEVLRCISRARVDACGQIRASFLLYLSFSKESIERKQQGNHEEFFLII